jgi:disulfide bond formation protein DsbB
MGRSSLLFLAWLFAAVSTLGSLFFSEVLGYPPCVLCWYQRICMYPLVLILGIGFLKEDEGSVRYALPVSIIGWVIAVYHNLLYYHILPESASPCVQGISCTTKFIEWLGFITIPLLALIGFTLILITLFIHRRKSV